MPAPWREAVATSALSCLVLAACEGGGGGVVIPGGDVPSDVLDMSGTWTLTVNATDPPFAFDCTGGLVGRSFSFCESFEVTVVQDGVWFLPGPEVSPGDRFCDSRFTMSGSSTLREISGAIGRTRTVGTVPPEVEIQDLDFRAGVLGDAATFALARLTLHGVDGECTLGGSYLGRRSHSP